MNEYIKWGKNIWYWFLSKIFKAVQLPHHDKWIADGYVFLREAWDEWYTPAVKEEMRKLSEITTYVNHEIEEDWDGKAELRQQAERRVHAGRPPVRGKTGMHDWEAKLLEKTFDDIEDAIELERLECERRKAHAKLTGVKDEKV